MYETLLTEAENKGLTVIEKYPFRSPRIRGLYCDDTIAISAQVDTMAERTVVLCEELTHADHSFGNILSDARMERRVRERVFDRLIGREKLVRALFAGCRRSWEFADWFGVPQPFFDAAMENYRLRYGTCTRVTLDDQNYILSFLPTLRVMPEGNKEDNT